MATSATTRRPSRVPGAKILITASALAATLAGWAALTWKEAAQSAAAAPSFGLGRRSSPPPGSALSRCPRWCPGPTQLPVGERAGPSTERPTACAPQRQRASRLTGDGDAVLEAVTRCTAWPSMPWAPKCWRRSTTTRPPPANAWPACRTGSMSGKSASADSGATVSSRRLNRFPGEPVEVSEVLWDALQASLSAARFSDGLVSPTLAPWIEAAGYDRTFEDLEESAAQPCTRACTTSRCRSRPPCSNSASRRVTLAAGSRLDLGGTAKGWAADRAVHRLRALGPCLVDAGGDVAVHGPRLDGQRLARGHLRSFPSGRVARAAGPARGGVATSGSRLPPLEAARRVAASHPGSAHRTAGRNRRPHGHGHRAQHGRSRGRRQGSGHPGQRTRPGLARRTPVPRRAAGSRGGSVRRSRRLSRYLWR